LKIELFSFTLQPAMAEDPSAFVRHVTPASLQPWENYICEHCEFEQAETLISYEDVVTRELHLDKQLCFRCTAAALLNMPNNLMFACEHKDQCLMPIRTAFDAVPDPDTQAEEHHPVKRMRTESRILDHPCDRCDKRLSAVSLQLTITKDQRQEHVSGDFCFCCAAHYLIDLFLFPQKICLKPGKTSLLDYP
jgi:hypothetical protein